MGLIKGVTETEEQKSGAPEHEACLHPKVHVAGKSKLYNLIIYLVFTTNHGSASWDSLHQKQYYTTVTMTG